MFQARIVNNRIAEVKALMKSQIDAAVLNANHDAAQLARTLCPVGDKPHADGSPHMRDTIAVTQDGNGAVKLTVADPAAGFVEFGHHTASGSYVPAHPFFTPAVESMKQDLEKRLTNGLEKG